MVSEIPPPDDTQSEWTIVGERIRVARESSGISVRELARRIGVSPSHVSNVERGLASFSVRALYSVVSHLDISMDSLFEDAKWGASQENAPLLEAVPDAPPAPRTRLDGSGIVLRKGERPTIHLGNRRWERLTSSSPLREAEFLEVHYAPGADKEELPDFLHHQSREWGTVIQGHLNVQVGYDEAVLSPGDSISFASNVPHRFWNESDEEVIAIWFVLDEGTLDKTHSDESDNSRLFGAPRHM